jgi:hypothetical protein
MKKITFWLFTLFTCVQIQAQVSLYSFAQSNQTYTEITGGTVLATATNEQTPVSLKWTLPASTIPFNFKFNGIDYTGCTIYSNGFLTFGTTEAAATATNPISATTTYSGAISAWTGSSCGVHIPGLITSEASWKVVGTAPNREFVIQFKDWRSVFATSVTDVAFVNFQIRLAETTNQIKIVYGPNGYKIGSAAYTGTRQIGLRGAAETDYKNRTNSTTQLFTASTAGTSNSVTQAINTSVATPGMPTNGLVYTYTPPVACTGTPVAGTVAPAAQNLCASSTPAVLTLTGNSEGFTGLTFQWETSTDNATWTNATGTSATTMVYSPPSFAGTASVYYRCKITCTGSALFSYSNVASVNPAAAPVGQATGLNFTNIAQLGFTANWINSDGNRRVVYISTSPIVDPVNGPGAAFTAATAYTGTGQQLVYDNTGSSVTVTGLLPNTQYYVKVIQYLRCGSAAPYDYYFNSTSVSNASTVTTTAPIAVPWEEGFATTTLPANWVNTSYYLSNSIAAINPALSTSYNVMNLYSFSPTGNIVTPIFASIPANYRFTYNYKIADYSAPNGPTAANSCNTIVAVSTNNGTTYTDVATIPNNGVAGWQTYALDLAAYTGQSIRIKVTTNWVTGDFYSAFDNFKIEAIPTCEAPAWSSLVASSVTATTATIAWTASTSTPANGYNYFVSTTNTNPLNTATPTGSVAAGIVTANLTALTGNTTYYVWVRSNCATSDVSSWSGPITFKTLCNNVTAFTQNFDASTALPSCWDKVGTLGSCYTSTSTPVGSAPNVIYFFGTSTSAPTMRMQPVSNLGAGTHRMKFKMRSSSATTLPSVDLGYLTNPYDATTFVSLTSIASTATTMVEYVYAPPAGTYSDYPAIKMNGTVYGTVYLDDFVWEAIPTCTDPSALVSANVTSSSVDISWDAPNPAPALGYQYVIATTNTPPTGAGTAVTTTFAQVTTGLLPTTQYYVFVRSICSATDISPWAGPITFTTACAPITTLPHVEPFATFLPSVCWIKGDNGNLTTGPVTFGTNSWFDDGFGNVGTTGSISYNIWLASANDWIISPQFTIPVTGWELKFDAAATNYGATTAVTNWEADDFVEVLVSSSTSGLTAWTVLYTYNNTNVPAPAGVPNIIDLDAYSGQTVRFAYRVVEGTADGSADMQFFVDNFEIRISPACPQPTNLVVSGITATGAATSWDAMSGAASGYQYVVSTSATPPTGAGTAITTAFVALTGLTPQTPYYLYVRANCGSGSFSVWSVQTFTTQCAPVTTLPWTEGFESVTTPAFAPCWSEENGDYATSSDTFNNTPKSGTKYLRDSWSATNEYMWTPGFQLTAGTSYDFSSWIQGDGGIGWVVDYFVNSSQVSTGATQLGGTYNVPGTGTLAIQPYAKITRTFVPTTSGVYYFAFRVNQPNFAPNYVAFDDVELKVTPNVIPSCATGLTATPDTACGNFANQLTWNAVTDATGYYVTIGTTSGGTNIANAVSVSSNSYSFSGTNNTQYFWKVVPYSGAGSATGCAIQLFTTVATGCYCASVPTSNDGSGITNATVGTTPFVIADVMYVNNTTTAIAVEPGTNTNVQLIFSTGYTYDINIWIDFNNDFDFNDAGELVKTGIACTAATPNTVDASFLMPLTAPTGPHRMRIGTADDGQVPPAPCYNGAYGVTLDFTVDTTLGSNSFDTSNFVAYPNPVKDVLNLSYKTAISNVKVINLLGQEVVNAKANTNDVQVNMSALNAGVYIVNVTVDDTIHSIKVIKE